MNTTLRLFIGGASLVIIVAGLKAISELLVPVFIAIFIATLLSPLVQKLAVRHIPYWLSLIIVFGLFVFVWIVFAGVVISSIQQFIGDLSTHTQTLNALLVYVADGLKHYGLEDYNIEISKILEPTRIVDLFTQSLNSLGNALTDTFLILLLVIFIIYDQVSFSERLKTAFPESKSSIANLAAVTEKINSYLFIKTITSLITGFIVIIGLLLIGVEHVLLWGFLAFTLNFIPNLGSIIAAIGPILLALIQLNYGAAILVALLYLAVNITIGSIVEPKIMGKQQGISPLVVLISLLFWGWVFGVVGMFLAVPLTVIVKILCESNKDTKGFARMLSD